MKWIGSIVVALAMLSPTLTAHAQEDEAVLLPGFPAGSFLSQRVWLFTTDLDGDGADEIIRTQSQLADGTAEDIHVIGFDGAPRAGFPVVLPLPPNVPRENSWEQPFLALDLNGSGERQLVAVLEIGGAHYELHAYDAGGAVVPGWPVALEAIEEATVEQWSGGDIDGDGADEVVISSRRGSTCCGPLRVLAIDSDGSLLWSHTAGLIQTYPESVTPTSGHVVLADLTGDGIAEVIASFRMQGLITVYGLETMILSGDGVLLDHWSSDYGVSLVADLNSDGEGELLGSNFLGYQILRADGTPRILGTVGNISAGTPRNGGSMTAGDLDGDGVLELGYPGQELEILRPNVDWDVEEAWITGDFDGYNESLGVTSSSDIYVDYESIVFADVDGDGEQEIIAASRSEFGLPPYAQPHYIHVYESDLSQELPGWPKEIPIEGVTQEMTRRVAVGDLDGDGDLEIVYASASQIYAWDIPQVDAPVAEPRADWTNFRGNGKWNNWYHEGRVPHFVRGDFDGDGDLTIADAIAALGYLFAAGDAGDCPGAADADANDVVQITDVILLLNYMFSPGSPSPVEAGECVTVGPFLTAAPCERYRCP